MQLASKFHHPTFNRSEVIVLINKQSDIAENIHLDSVGNYDSSQTFLLIDIN